MKKKLVGKSDLVATKKDQTPAEKKTDTVLTPDTLYPMNLMECPYCRMPIAGYTKNESAECQECGQTYIVLKATRVVFALT